MKINGMGNVSKKEVESILTRDGRQAVEKGDMTWEEAGEMYKLCMVKRASKIGSCGDTFKANYGRIPEEIVDKLSPEEIASLVDAFYDCYSDGKSN